MFSTRVMSRKTSVLAFKALADRVGMCPAAALLDPQETAAGIAGDGQKVCRLGRSGILEESGPFERSEAEVEDWGRAWSLPRRQLWECVCAGPSVGGQSLLECWLRADWQTGAYHALVDASLGLDPETLADGLAERLLWVPVRGPDQMVKALDLLLRDDNFALVAADLRGLSVAHLRGIQPFVWYRLQRLAHQRAGGAVVFSSMPSVRCADRRIQLATPRRIDDLDRPRESLLDLLEATVRSYPKGQLPQLPPSPEFPELRHGPVALAG